MQNDDYGIELDSELDTELKALPQRARGPVAAALQHMRRMQGPGLYPREHEIREGDATTYELRTYGYPRPITQDQLESVAIKTAATEVYMRLSDQGSQLRARGALVVHIKVPPPGRKRAGEDEEEEDDDADDSFSIAVAKRRTKKTDNDEDNEPGWLARLWK